MRYVALISCCLLFQFSFSQIDLDNPLLADDLKAQQKWVDSIYESMTLKERIGQLFMVQVYSDEKQLDDLRKKTKECFLTFTDPSGAHKKVLVKKPRVVFGKSKDADIKISGWFAPAVAATLEKQGGQYELVPNKRGKVEYQGKPISEPTTVIDGYEFSVRGRTFKFFNRLTKTS